MGEAKRRRSAGNRNDTKPPRDPVEQAAAVIDAAYRRVTLEGIHGPASIPRMAGHLPALKRIYDTVVRDEDLMALCARYPAFQRFAETVEDECARERASNMRDSFGPPLPEPLRLWLERLLPIAAELEQMRPGADASGGIDSARRRAESFGTEVRSFLAAARNASLSTPALDHLSSILNGYLDRIEAAVVSSGASDEPRPIPIANLVDVVAFVERQIGVVEELATLLEPAVRRNRVLDNETVLRVQDSVAMHRNSLFGVREQLTAWRRGVRLSAEQTRNLDALELRLAHWEATNEAIATLAGKFEGKTIEAITAMSDAEIALAVLSGRLMLPPR